jgi:hypothetical protein
MSPSIIFDPVSDARSRYTSHLSLTALSFTQIQSYYDRAKPFLRERGRKLVESGWIEQDEKRVRTRDRVKDKVREVLGKPFKRDFIFSIKKRNFTDPSNPDEDLLFKLPNFVGSFDSASQLYSRFFSSRKLFTSECNSTLQVISPEGGEPLVDIFNLLQLLIPGMLLIGTAERTVNLRLFPPAAWISSNFREIEEIFGSETSFDYFLIAKEPRRCFKSIRMASQSSISLAGGNSDSGGSNSSRRTSRGSGSDFSFKDNTEVEENSVYDGQVLVEEFSDWKTHDAELRMEPSYEV